MHFDDELMIMMMIMIMMMMMNMMVKIKMAITWTIFKLGSPDFPGHELCMQSGSQGP